MIDEPKPVEKEKPVLDEIATTKKDIDIFAGWVRRLENPDPTLRSEAAGKGIKLYDEVDRDAHAGAVLQSRYLAVLGKEWGIVPGKNAVVNGLPASSDRDYEISDFVESKLTSCKGFRQAKQDLLQAILYGYYAAEVLWAINPDGSIVPGRVRGKHPRRFIFTPDRDLRLLTPDNMIDGEELPPRKFIVFTCGDSDNPYGKGLGQKLWWWVWFKKNGVKFWLIFQEKFGMPTTVGKYPPGTAKPEQDKLLDAINAIHAETGVKIPDNMKIELLEAARAGNAGYDIFCEYCDKQISKAVLSQTLTTEVGSTGSFAASQTHEEIKQEIVEADADLLDECLNDTLIRWIVDYNFPGIIDFPQYKTYASPKPDLTAQSNIDKSLVKEIGLPVGKKYFYEKYGIPEPEEGEDLVSASQMPQGAPGYPGGMNMPAGFAEALRFLNNAKRAPETMASQLDAAIDPIVSEMIDKVKALVTSVGSMEDIRDGLSKAFPDAPPEQLGEIMARAFAAAELTGRADVLEEA